MALSETLKKNVRVFYSAVCHVSIINYTPLKNAPMHKLILSLTFITATITATSIISCQNNKENSDALQASSADSLLKRGEYLVTIMGCDDCHSPNLWVPRALN
jgi:hypothetical protein